MAWCWRVNDRPLPRPPQRASWHDCFWHASWPSRAAARLISRADRARDSGAYGKAAEYYSRALDFTPARLDIRVQLGNMLKEAGKHQAVGIHTLMEVSPNRLELHAALDRIAETLPEIQAQLAFSVAAMIDFANFTMSPSRPPRLKTSRSFTVFLPVDREPLQSRCE